MILVEVQEQGHENLPRTSEYPNYRRSIFLVEGKSVSMLLDTRKGLRANQYLINRTIKPRLKRDGFFFLTELSIGQTFRHKAEFGVSAVIKVCLNWNSFAQRTPRYLDMVCILLRGTFALCSPHLSIVTY